MFKRNLYIFLLIQFCAINVLLSLINTVHAQNGNNYGETNANGVEASFYKEQVEIDPRQSFFNVLSVVNVSEKKKQYQPIFRYPSAGRSSAGNRKITLN